MGNPAQFDWGGEDLVVKSIIFASTPGGAQTPLTTALTTTTITPTTIAGNANFTGTPTFGSLTASGTVTGGQVSAGAIADGAAIVLTAAQSGSTCVFSTVTGSQFTLPTPVVGMEFFFVCEASVTSGSYKFLTNSASVFLKGSVYDIVASTGVQTNFAANGTTIVAATMNGTTTGGLIGTWYRVIAKSTTVWEVYGNNYATGTVATPFATS